MRTVTCPQCRRELTPRKNKFGDPIYPRHKMARAWTRSGMPSASVADDLALGHNPAALYTYELDCPVSGQPVE